MASPEEPLTARLADLERRLGADRPGRNGWVWLVPLLSAVGTFLIVIWLDQSGDLGFWIRLPIAVLGALFMGGMSAAYLAAFAADARDDGDDAPVGR